MTTRAVRFAALGTMCEVLAEHTHVEEASLIVRRQLTELDRVCSRSRADSELSRMARGRSVPVSRLLATVLDGALRAAARTGGLVDPTVATVLPGLADAVSGQEARRAAACTDPAPGYWRIVLDPARRQVLIPHAVEVDVRVSAGAWAADQAAWTCASRLPGGFLVNVGGAVSVSGTAPAEGWRVSIDDGSPPLPGRPVVTIRRGGLATSTAAIDRGAEGRLVSSVVDPRSGACVPAHWRAVTVVAASAELAASAAAAALVLGLDAPQWLARRRLHARLLSVAGEHFYVGDWPTQELGPVRPPD